MQRKHPLSALLFVWTIDLIAILFVINTLPNPRVYSVEEWIHFAIWTLLLCTARVGGIIEFIGKSFGSGWAKAVEFAAVIVLPYPLLNLALLISLNFIVLDRMKKKHPEPFLGPDFNTAAVILSAFAAHHTHQYTLDALGHSTFAHAVALLPTTLLYGAIPIVLLTILLSLDLNLHWKQIGTLQAENILSGMTMVAVGGLFGTVYEMNPFLIGLMLLPILFLHNALDKMNQAKLVYIDAKTGVYNYRYFDEKFSELFAKAEKSNKSIALVFGDMDYLRDINNTYGHQIGDQALEKIARAFREAAGPDATACRFGGEEFVMILPNCDSSKAYETAERVRQAISDIRIPVENEQQLTLSMSFGVAAYPQDASSGDDLIKAADEAVYAAKHAGRNQVKRYMDPITA